MSTTATLPISEIIDSLDPLLRTLSSESIATTTGAVSQILDRWTSNNYAITCIVYLLDRKFTKKALVEPLKGLKGHDLNVFNCLKRASEENGSVNCLMARFEKTINEEEELSDDEYEEGTCLCIGPSVRIGTFHTITAVSIGALGKVVKSFMDLQPEVILPKNVEWVQTGSDSFKSGDFSKQKSKEFERRALFCLGMIYQWLVWVLTFAWII